MHYRSTKWGVYMLSLKWLLEKGIGAPYPDDRDTDLLSSDRQTGRNLRKINRGVSYGNIPDSSLSGQCASRR